MVHIVTTARIDQWFDPSHVVRVTESLNGPGTSIYGVTATALEVVDPPAAFLGTLGIAGDFVQLTRPDGKPTWVKARSVVLVRPVRPGEYPAAAKSYVDLGGPSVGVVEAPQDAVNVLKGGGAPL
jgi:hypothetical protein